MKFLIKQPKLAVVSLASMGIALIAILLASFNPRVKIAEIPEKLTQPVQFTGRQLLVASDADMVATAYADGQLDQVEGIEDALTVVNLPLDRTNPAVTEIEASNSVMNWPQTVTASPDGTKAYIIETRGQVPNHIQAFDDIWTDMPSGELLTIVDLTNPSNLKVLEKKAIAKSPNSVSISPDGKFLAIDNKEKGKELVIVELENGLPKASRHFTIDHNSSEVGVIRAISWHPFGRYLALNLGDTEIAFYEFTADGSIEPFDDRLKLGTRLSEGKFTPDGNYFVITDTGWGEGTLGAIFNRNGKLFSIGFDEDKGKHQLVSETEVGLSPEGLAMSPDGSMLVTVNMRRTYAPEGILRAIVPGTEYSSLSLVTMNLNSGELTTVGEEYGFEGLLAEDAVFDSEGKSVAVVIYNYREPSPKTGAIEFWNVISTTDKPKLERTGFKIDVTRGSHSMYLVE